MTATLARRARSAFVLPLLGALALALPQAPGQALARGGAVCGNARSVQFLARISNTRNDDVQCLGIKLDGDTIAALRVETHRFAGAAADRMSDHVKVAEFPVAQIESPQGAVLDGAQGHDAVILQGRAVPSGGNVELTTRYLYNGLTGEYRSCRVTLHHSADAAWRLLNQNNETVSRIVIRTRRVPVLGTIGIANLDGACGST